MNERYQLIAALSGPALKIVMVLVLEHRQMAITELEAYTGCDKNTVRKGLAQLALYGLASQIISSRETWTLTDKGFQLPLPIASLPSGDACEPIPPAADAPPDPGPAPTAKPDDVPPEPGPVSAPIDEPADAGQSEGNPTIAPAGGENFSPPVTTTASINLNIKDYTSSSSSNAPDGEILTTAPPEHDKSATERNLAALHQAGIKGKKAETLSRLAWITPDYIAAHVEAVHQSGQRLGLAIYRMECGDDAPETPRGIRTGPYTSENVPDYILH